MMFADVTIAAPDAPPSQQGGSLAPDAAMEFDLPMQPLAQALEHYGAVTGLQVVYDGSLATDRWSAPVKGTLSPRAGLQRLLAGTGLSARYMAADGFMLVRIPPPAEPQTDPLVNSASPAVVTQYYGRIQSRLEDALCTDPRTRSGGYRLAVGLWIEPSGTVRRSVLLGSTGTSDRDAAVDHMLQGLEIGAPPPVGFAEPVTFIAGPDLARDCSSIEAAEPPSRTTP